MAQHLLPQVHEVSEPVPPAPRPEHGFVALLDRTGVHALMEARIAELHAEASENLMAAADTGDNPARDALGALVGRLADRKH